MTNLLNKALQRVQALPATVQDEVARKLITYIDKIEALRADLAAAEASGGDDELDMSQIKAEARRRSAIRK